MAASQTDATAIFETSDISKKTGVKPVSIEKMMDKSEKCIAHVADQTGDRPYSEK